MGDAIVTSGASDAAYRAVTAYEEAFKRGENPELTDYLPIDFELRRVVLLPLVKAEIELRWTPGSSDPDYLKGYLNRFPELEADAEAVSQLSSLLLSLNGRSTSQGSRTGPYVPSPSPGPSPPIVPGFELIEKLGRGGMGIVWKARDNLNRIVALKMVLGAVPTEQEMIRFLAEAESIAAVSHPHVVQVYEFGNADGRPFMAMECLLGGSLAARLGRGKRLNPRTATEFVAKLAEAVQAAHDQGIIHRDLKPGNVLFDDRGEPKVTDFGLAKKTGGADITRTQAVMGSPAYMAPEQARGDSKFVGVRADVWALGAMLYECLTGKRAFDGDDPWATMHKVIHEAPRSPRAHVPDLPRDLELITLKCLEKNLDQRYPTAAALAEDLRRYLAHEPISVRPAGRFERATKWVRRNPVVAGAIAAVVFVVFVGAGVSIYFGLDARREADRANGETEKAKNSEADAVNKGNELTSVNGDLVRTVDKLGKKETELTTANGDLQQKKGELEQKNDENSRQLVRVKIAAADERINAGNPVAALPFLAEGLATLEKHRVTDSPLERSLRMKFASIAALAPKPVRVWTEPDAVIHAEFASNGSRILTVCRDGTARVCDAATGDVVGKILRAQTAITCAALDPTGALAVTGGKDGHVRVWKVASGDPVLAPLALAVPVLHVAFSPDGRHVLAAGGERFATTTTDPPRNIPQPKGPPLIVPGARHTPRGFVTMWELPTEPGGELKKLGPFIATGWTNHVAFSPSNNEIAIGSASSASDNKQRVQIRGLDATPDVKSTEFKHESPVLQVNYSPDGQRVVTACGGVWSKRQEAIIWDIGTGESVGQPLTHDDAVTLASFNHDGSLVLTGSDDGTARLWDAATAQPVSPPLAHLDRITAASFSPDGKYVLTAGRDGMVRVWHGTRFNVTRKAAKSAKADELGKAGEPALPPLPHGSPILSAAFSRDGTRFVTACENGVVRVWDIAAALANNPTFQHGEKVNYATAVGDKFLVTVTGNDTPTSRSGGGEGSQELLFRNRKIHLWARADPTQPQRSAEHTGPAGAWLVRPDGSRASTARGESGFFTSDVLPLKYSFWPLQAGEPLPQKTPNSGAALWSGFNSAGRCLAVAVPPDDLKNNPRRQLIVIDGDTGEKVAGPLQHGASVRKVVVSDDGSTLVTVVATTAPAAGARPLAAETTAHVWNLQTGEPRGEYRVPNELILGTAPGLKSGCLLALSPKGGGLAVVQSSEVRIHRVGSDDPPVVLPVRNVLHVAFSADEKLVATASADQTARVWTVATGQPQGTSLEHRGQVTFAAFSPCGRYVVTAGQDRTARVWDAQTTQPLTPWLFHRGPVVHASFAPDGVRLVTASHDGTARVWEALSADDRPVAELALVAEVLTGQRPGAVGGNPNATPGSYLDAWKQLSTARPKDYASR